MFSFVKQVFIVLLSFSVFLATKRFSLNDEPCMIGPTLTDLNLIEPKYYPFMIGLGECNGSCNVLSPKMCRPKKKMTNIKEFNMVKNKNEAKAMTKHISCDCKCKFNSTTCNSNQKWNNKTCQCECKSHCKSKKDYSWNPGTRTYENSKYLKSMVDTSVITFDEIISLMDVVSTKKANALVINISNKLSQ